MDEPLEHALRLARRPAAEYRPGGDGEPGAGRLPGVAGDLRSVRARAESIDKGNGTEPARRPPRFRYDRRAARRVQMGAIESVGSHLAGLLPDAGERTLGRLERAATLRTFRRSDVLHARGIARPPSLVLDGHVILRRVAETGQVRAALIAGSGYLGGLRSISDPEAEAFHELVALTDGTWATWDPRFLRGLALEDAGLAVGLLDHSADYAAVLNVRLDERNFQSARQRMAAILTRYGSVIFDTPHPVARRADLAAMIGTSREMMGRSLRDLEADGLVRREHGGGIRILDAERLAQLVTVAAPEGATTL